MKTNKANTIDPQREELQKLEALLNEYKQARAEIADHEALLGTARAEIDVFIDSGDLRDEKALGSILICKLQAELTDSRLQKLAMRAGEIEDRMIAETKVVRGIIATSLYAVRNGLVEQIAQSMRENFPDLQAARKTAFQSPKVIEVSSEVHSVTNGDWNADPDEAAAKLLGLAPKVFAREMAIKEALGGSIPSESELRAF